MIKIPTQNKFSQTNESDKSGNIYITKNINFDKKGYIGLEKRTRAIADENTCPDLFDSQKVLVSVARRSSETWLAGTKNLYWCESNDFPVFTKDTATNTPTLDSYGNSDMVEWDNNLIVCNDSTVYEYDGGAGAIWNTISTRNGEFLTAFVNLNQLAISEGDEVTTINTDYDEVQTLQIPEGFHVTSMAWNNLRLYVATTNDEGNAVLLEWDGLTSEANTGYQINGHTIYSVTPYKQGVALLTSRGELLYCQGGLQELARLPIYFSDEVWDDSSTTSSTGRPVKPRGLYSDGDNIYIGVTAKNENYTMDRNRGRYNNTFLSGVWCYNPSVGLYHKYSVGSSALLSTDAINTTDVDTSTNIITVSGATVPVTGTPCFYAASPYGSGTEIPELESGKKYYVINVTSTTMKVASSYANAIAGTEIDLTDDGNVAQYFTFNSKADFGGIGEGISLVTGITDPNDFGRPFAMKLFIGGNIQQPDADASTGTCAAVEAYQENRGYLITPRIFSTELADITNSISIKWKKLVNPEDKIIVKYRATERDLPTSRSYTDEPITWTSSTQFTSINDLSNVEVGDEAEIIQGMGAGYLAHVTAITESAGTYTVTIDEAVQNLTVGDSSYVLFDNWTKLSTITTDSESNIDSYKITGLGSKKRWVQFKIELRGMEPQIEEIIINNINYKPTKK